MKPIAVLVAGLLLTAVSSVAVAVEAPAADRSCVDEKGSPSTTATAATKTDPEPGRVKGKVGDLWQKVRWQSKSVEARSTKEALSEARERVRAEPVEVEVDVPEVPDRF